MLKNNQSRFVGLKAMADGSLLRTATLYDKPYIVVPIISAVGDEVWWPANSDAPELVPADVLESAYWSRNNRPIVAGHPRKNGEFISANSPEILEQYAYGFTCNSQFDDKRVKVEAWFSKEMAKKVGPSAEKVISRLENGEMIEVSEGNMVISEAKEGELGGKPYKSVWLSCVNDHLATVSKGACDNEMGCGGPRVSQISSLLVNEASKMNDKTKKDNMFRRMFASMTEALKSAMSNNELRMKLFNAVSVVDKGVEFVHDEDVEAKTFIYRVCIKYGSHWDSYDYDYKLYRRSFEINGNDVTIGDDAVEVEWFEGWRDKNTTATTEPEAELTASSESEIINEPSTCSCHSQKEKEVPLVNASEKKALVSKLISASKGFIPEELSESLAKLSEDRLNSMLSVYEGEAQTITTTTPAPTSVTPETIAATPVAPVSPTDQVILSKEEYEEIKASSNAHKAQIEAHKSTLISSLKSAQTAFTEDHLRKMDIDTLERLAQSLNINEPATADYSVRGRAESKVASAPAMRELPNTWGISN